MRRGTTCFLLSTKWKADNRGFPSSNPSDLADATSHLWLSPSPLPAGSEDNPWMASASPDLSPSHCPISSHNGQRQSLYTRHNQKGKATSLDQWRLAKVIVKQNLHRQTQRIFECQLLMPLCLPCRLLLAGQSWRRSGGLNGLWSDPTSPYEERTHAQETQVWGITAIKRFTE